MEPSMTIFNASQLHLLEMFKYCNTQDSLDEMKNVLAEYYARKVQTEADELWDDGVLDNASIEKILDTHLRTPYIQK